jgi:hypothetical protein
MMAAAIGCRTCANLLGFSVGTVHDTSGTVTGAHNGQSMFALDAAASEVLSNKSDTTIFIPPELVQTICVSVGFNMGDAMATPMNNANHTSTKRAKDLCVAAFVMWRIIAQANSLFSQVP